MEFNGYVTNEMAMEIHNAIGEGEGRVDFHLTFEIEERRRSDHASNVPVSIQSQCIIDLEIGEGFIAGTFDPGMAG